MPDPGPIESRQEAMALPSVAAAFEAARKTARTGVLAESNHRTLCTALSDAGVVLGAYEHDLIVRYFGTEEPHVVAVLARWIAEANKKEDVNG